MKNVFQLSAMFFVFLLQMIACKVDRDSALENLSETTFSTPVDSVSRAQNRIVESHPYITPEGWTELSKTNGFVTDIRYATDNNFTKKQIYDCARCLLRKDVADALILLQTHLKTHYNLGIKLFDCYRPAPYQQRLWDAVPNASYVTPPSKGSMHSRGMAIDLTLIDSLGNELDMGTEYDFFGKEAHIDYTQLSEKVLENRRFFHEKMKAYGFEGIRTEWWHFAFTRRFFPLDKFVWSCDNN